ncbi:hypothetical protein MKW11_06910 [Gluconobacter frateurii]|uniref:hypothetical protein n=1 Tax=Gluconobacter frateurii TaxID=38308 RepID=UPI001F0548AB|nr:hypothetical protein [Gluconobacter frateurii]UMM09769.1 hypothetical protein MKW11_06910 [Gluconobacter frateurii]
MSFQKRLHSLLGALSLGALPFAANAAPVEDKPSFPSIAYWDNWTDTDGVTHLTHCKFSDFHEDSLSPSADKVLLGRAHTGSASVTMRVQPPKWKGGWNESHQVQWVVPLSGIYFVQAMDGTRVELNPGDILLSEDLNATPDRAGHRGHLSGNVGDDSVALLVTQFTQAAPLHQPCHWE